MEVSIILGLETFNDGLEHSGPLLEHLLLIHESLRKWIVHVHGFLRTLDALNICLKVSDLHVGSGSQSTHNRCKDLFEPMLV